MGAGGQGEDGVPPDERDVPPEPDEREFPPEPGGMNGMTAMIGMTPPSMGTTIRKMKPGFPRRSGFRSSSRAAARCHSGSDRIHDAPGSAWVSAGREASSWNALRYSSMDWGRQGWPGAVSAST